MSRLSSPSTGGRSDDLPRQPAKKAGFLDWQVERYYDRELLAGVVRSRRPSSCIGDLLQNCDLPPPLNHFSPIQHDGGCDDQKSKNEGWDDRLALNHDGDAGNPTLMRALQLSQTRAREAESKAVLAGTRNEQMAVLLLRESLRLSAHRRWLQLLEIEISMLQAERQTGKQEEQRDGDAAPVAASWCLAVALCLGVVGVGFVLGRYM